MRQQVEAPGGYDAQTVFSTMADMATTGGSVEAAAQQALADFQENGDLSPDAISNLLAECVNSFL